MYSTKFPASRGLFSLVLGGRQEKSHSSDTREKKPLLARKVPDPQAYPSRAVQILEAVFVCLFFCSPLPFVALHTIYHLNSPPCKGIRIPESRKFLLVESGIMGFGIQNTAQGIRNPTYVWNPESKFH